ncbi:hypothetical protein MKW92_042962 [Papaver armeniacum]|nr:hypothetical protein MKW92_042962 [Papaver armeniacum]
MSANITLRAPPRSKKSSKKAGRINSSVEKGKVKRKSVLRKEKQAKKPTKTKPVTGKRKRSARHDPVMDKEKAKKKTTQMKVVRKDEKIRKPQSADSNVEEVIYSDSDVEEATIFGSIPPSALEVDKNGVSASLLGRLALQQESTSSLTYYCPQLLVEVYGLICHRQCYAVASLKGYKACVVFCVFCKLDIASQTNLI